MVPIPPHPVPLPHVVREWHLPPSSVRQPRTTRGRGGRRVLVAVESRPYGTVITHTLCQGHLPQGLGKRSRETENARAMNRRISNKELRTANEDSTVAVLFPSKFCGSLLEFCGSLWIFCGSFSDRPRLPATGHPDTPQFATPPSFVIRASSFVIPSSVVISPRVAAPCSRSCACFGFEQADGEG